MTGRPELTPMISAVRAAIARRLAAHERRGLSPPERLEYRPLFVISLPRSGSTLFYQLLLQRFRLAYFSNLMAAFPGEPGDGRTHLAAGSVASIHPQTSRARSARRAAGAGRTRAGGSGTAGCPSRRTSSTRRASSHARSAKCVRRWTSSSATCARRSRANGNAMHRGCARWRRRFPKRSSCTPPRAGADRAVDPGRPSAFSHATRRPGSRRGRATTSDSRSRAARAGMRAGRRARARPARGRAADRNRPLHVRELRGALPRAAGRARRRGGLVSRTHRPGARDPAGDRRHPECAVAAQRRTRGIRAYPDDARAPAMRMGRMAERADTRSGSPCQALHLFAAIPAARLPVHAACMGPR